MYNNGSKYTRNSYLRANMLYTSPYCLSETGPRMSLLLDMNNRIVSNMAFVSPLVYRHVQNIAWEVLHIVCFLTGMLHLLP